MAQLRSGSELTRRGLRARRRHVRFEQQGRFVRSGISGRLIEYGLVALILLEHRDGESDDLRRIFAWLDHDGLSVGGPAEFVPSMDVLETKTTVEIVADLPGIRPEALRVVFASNALVVAGQKRPSPCEHKDAAFRLAERSFGRFARVFRLSGAFDAGRARATLRSGELHIVIPRIEERRGGELRIPVTTE